jgi:serine protease Do
MNIPNCILSSLVFCQVVAMAQDDIPLLRPEERQVVDAQTQEFNQSLLPALAKAAQSTVRIWAGNQRLAYGTVIGDGQQILTKWSELAGAAANLRVVTADGVALGVKVAGVYADEDLVVLPIDGVSLPPVQWSSEDPPLGAFLAACQPDGRPAAFGVVSVLERNLRDADQAYLGVVGMIDFPGPGVKIREVTRSSAASAAGLRPGNVILQVGERPISGLLELKNALVGVKPGAKIALRVQTGAGEKQVMVELGNRPPLPDFPSERLRQMERMGGPISRVRDGFARVIQTDMRPQPDQMGGPVVDLSGRVVGITVARADRTRSFVMPASAVENLLKKAPQEPSVAQVRMGDEVPTRPGFERGQPGHRQWEDPERMRRHVIEMQRLLDFMRQEMQGLEP